MIVHIVQFAFKQSATEAEIKALVGRMLAFKETCLQTERDGKPYIVSCVGGRNNSPEGVNKGLTHGFVLTFASLADRDYYLDRDPVHVAFKDEALRLAADACVVDFEPGVY